MGNENANRFYDFLDGDGKVYKDSNNSLISRARLTNLPSILNWHYIAILWACDGSSVWPSPSCIQTKFVRIVKAVQAGELALVPENEDQKKPIEVVRIGEEEFTSQVIKQGIERKEFFDWLKSTGKWPLKKDCLLLSWFVDLLDEQHIQEVTVDHLNKNSLVVKEPQSKDDWADVMLAASQSFFSIHDRKPTKKELWNHILRNTMPGCDITLLKDSKESCLMMDGDEKLTLKRSNFNKRFDRYWLS